MLRTVTVTNQKGFRLNRIHNIAASVALCLAAVATAAAAELPLTVAQVEKATGLSGLSTKQAKYDKAGTNFITSGGDLALTVKLAGAQAYEIWKSHPSIDDQAPFAGLGEDAVRSRKGRYICFRKSGTGLCVVGMPGLAAKPALVSEEQLLELARLAAARL